MKRIFIAMLVLLAATPSIQVKAQTTIIEDSLGQHQFDNIPQRVIAIDWASVENLIELGVPPIAMAGKKDYQTWVRIPALPDAIIDIGTRDAPNIERISQLKPDVIFISGMQKNLLPKLRAIAPTLVFEGHSKDHNNYHAARNIFTEQSKLFNKQALAKQKLAAMEQRFNELKTQLNNHFAQGLPKVTTIRFNNAALAWVYGDNAMPQYALEQLGISSAMPLPTTQWGLVQKKIVELGKIDNGIVLYFEPFDQKDKLFSSPLWNAMPFVGKEHFAAVPATWTYGGPMSVLYLAEAMSAQLLTIEP